jgi:hypothetical protein
MLREGSGVVFAARERGCWEAERSFGVRGSTLRLEGTLSLLKQWDRCKVKDRIMTSATCVMAQGAMGVYTPRIVRLRDALYMVYEIGHRPSDTHVLHRAPTSILQIGHLCKKAHQVSLQLIQYHLTRPPSHNTHSSSSSSSSSCT